MVFVKARSWDGVGLATVGFLGILGVRRREATFFGSPGSPGSPGPSAPRVTGRCIVTGASSGMGAEVVHSLAEAGAAEVIMACRSLERCEKTRQQLFRRCVQELETTLETETMGRASVQRSSLRAARRRHCMEMQRKMVCKLLDLTSAKSIQRFGKDIQTDQTDKQQIILVNNGGTMADSKESDLADSQVDLQMRTNHCGHFMLTQLLLPSMDPTSSVIVVMASRAHRQGSLALSQGEDISETSQFLFVASLGMA